MNMFRDLKESMNKSLNLAYKTQIINKIMKIIQGIKVEFNKETVSPKLTK